jgi:hypothetical protein
MIKRILFAGLLLLVSLASQAEGLPMKPGQWEMKMTMEMSMLPAPQVRTSTECVTENELNPESFQMDENSGCTAGDLEIEGNTARWSISCPGPAGDMTGNWEFTSDEDSVVGTGSMSADMNGMALQMNMNWEGKRLGDCPE